MNLIIRIVMVLFLIIGILTSFYGVYVIQKSMQSKNWPNTEGIITNSKIEVNERTIHKAKITETKTYYEPNVTYDYEIEGVSYLSNKIFLGQYSSTSYNYASDIISKYSVGKKVTVYYDPKDPSTAILESGISLRNFIALLTGLAFIVVGILGYRRTGNSI